MAKLLEVEGKIGEYRFWCEGCQCAHGVWTIHPNELTHALWSFNNNFEKPTFSPSILVQWQREKGKPMVCHSYVTEGKIQYLADCTHSLVGKTVDLLDFDNLKPKQ